MCIRYVRYVLLFSYYIHPKILVILTLNFYVRIYKNDYEPRPKYIYRTYLLRVCLVWLLALAFAP
jgi:hypothetical protein